MLQVVQNLMNSKTKIKIFYKIKKRQKFKIFLKNFKKFIVEFWAKLQTMNLKL